MISFAKRMGGVLHRSYSSELAEGDTLLGAVAGFLISLLIGTWDCRHILLMETAIFSAWVLRRSRRHFGGCILITLCQVN
jgi:hypothetical protein